MTGRSKTNSKPVIFQGRLVPAAVLASTSYFCDPNKAFRAMSFGVPPVTHAVLVVVAVGALS